MAEASVTLLYIYEWQKHQSTETQSVYELNVCEFYIYKLNANSPI